MDKLNYRVLPDGKIAFPCKGDPPSRVPGFKVTSDPYIFEPDLEPCPFRVFEKRVKPCGKIDYPMACSYLKQLITYKVCDECEVEV